MNIESFKVKTRIHRRKYPPPPPPVKKTINGILNGTRSQFLVNEGFLRCKGRFFFKRIYLVGISGVNIILHNRSTYFDTIHTLYF